MSYYDELGVKPDATNEEIRRAYRRKAKQNHPDRGGSADKMAAVNKAYETLSQPQRRLTYDRIGEDRPPDIEHVARNILTGRIIAWMDSDQTTGDLIADVERSLIAEQRNQNAEIRKGTQLLERLQKRIKRLKFKGKGIDLVSAAVDSKIRDIKQTTEKMKDHVANLERAKELLPTYEFEPEIQAPTGTFMVFGR